MGDEFWFLIEAWSGRRQEQFWPRAREPQRLKNLVAAALRRDASPEAAQPILLMDPFLEERDYMEIENIRDASVCSQRFVDSARQASDHSATYPIRMLRSDTGLPVEKPFYLWIPQRVDKAIDWKRSEEYVDRLGRRRLTKICLSHSLAAGLPSIFRPVGSVPVIAHERVRLSMEEARVSGVEFAPLDSAFMPWDGVKAEALRRHLLERPDDADGWNELGRVMVGLHRQGQALEAFERALTLKPGLSETLYLRGIALQELGKRLEALESFRRATEQGKLKSVPVAYPRLLREIGRYEEALTVAEGLVEHYKDSPIAWLELGSAHAQLEHFPMALYALDQAEALGIDPHRDVFFAAKGEVLFRLGEYEQAMDTFEEGVRSSGTGIELWRGKAKALRALGRAIEAELVEEQVRKLLTSRSSKWPP